MITTVNYIPTAEERKDIAGMNSVNSAIVTADNNGVLNLIVFLDDTNGSTIKKNGVTKGAKEGQYT